ncbi:MAG TPA: PIG-L deacetylase family protein [Bacteroidia bacterium]|jgi:LmbE family N-acetylglucosaminyl deacetylase
MIAEFKKVLVLAPHTDDGEFGCGGTISRLVESGCEVYYAAFSACEQSVKKEFPPDILITEVKAATSVLGIRPENLFLYEYQVRMFNYRRQEILQTLIELREKIRPEAVFMPSTDDIHQDHFTIAQEGLRAFKFNSIFCYEMPWNNVTFNTSAFFYLQEKHIQRKVKALMEYRSQAHRPYANEEFIRALARTRGVQINTHYAETFNVLRYVVH